VPEPQRTASIMIVADDPDHAELARRTVAGQDEAGVVAWFADGVTALEHLRATAAGGTDARRDPVPLPDLVLLDLRLCRRDGLDVLAEIKHDPRLKTIPVVAFADYGDAADVALAYRHHANSFLVKPAGREDLARMMRDVVRYWLARNRPAPAPAPR
jgi:CheY-like chemotaxis protein